MAYSLNGVTRLGHLKALAQRSLLKISEVTTAITEAIEEIAAAVSDLFSDSTDQGCASRISLWSDYHAHTRMEAEIAGEAHTITLTNSEKRPFNSTLDNPVSVALTTPRKTLFYTVETEIASHTGIVGEIEISAKALNGFKIAFTGSATSVTLNLRIKGGMS